MDLLTLFRQLLQEQNNAPSLSTVKNYVSDLRSFIKWFEAHYGRACTPKDFSQEIIESYFKSSSLSPRSKNRQAAAVRKMTQLLYNSKLIDSIPLPVLSKPVVEDLWKLREFKHTLFTQKASPLTIKNYLSDIVHFTKWIDSEYGIQKNQTISEDIINSYKHSLVHVMNLSPKSVNRKLSSIRKYAEFYAPSVKEPSQQTPPVNVPSPVSKREQSPIPALSSLENLEAFRVTDTTYSPLPPVRLFQRIGVLYGHFEEYCAFSLAKLIPKGSVLPQRVIQLQSLRTTRPQWYHKYHALPFTKHIHIGILSVFCAGLFVYGYARYIDIPTSEEVLGISQQHNRVLVYSGKLTSKDNLPITSPTELVFSIYPHPSANDSVLWKEHHKINPNRDGSFTIQLGRQNALKDSFFAENHDLYLGMKVGSDAELLPRQRLANVGYSSDSMLLDGMAPITRNPAKSENSILALNSSGNLVIGGAANPVFQASGGDFTVSGISTILTTNSGSNGDLVLNPDGSGVIDVRRPIVNDSQEASASGSVDFADEVSVATESAGSVVSIHNTGESGAILSLLSRNATRMIVDNTGNVGIGTTVPSQLVHLAHTSSPTLRLENLLSGNTVDISSLETLASIGTTTQSALGLKTNSLMRMTITPDGNVGIGTTAPSALLDVSGSASISGSLTFTGGVRNIQSANNNNLIIGGNTTGNLILQPLNGSGFVGIATNSPEYKLDILDSQADRAAMHIYNASNSTDADGLIIKLGNNRNTVSESNEFISFQTQGMGTVGSIRGSTNGSGVAYYTTHADFAEYIKKDLNETFEYGHLACLTQLGTVSKCSASTPHIVGVTSQSPGFLGGKNLGNRSIAVGLVGQIQTFVSTDNGPIRAGDPITVSSAPGIGVKATQGGTIVGRALESYTGNTPGKILVLVQPSWYEPAVSFTVSGDLVTTSVPSIELDTAVYEQVASALAASTYSVTRENQLVKTVASFSSATIGTIKSGLIEAQSLIVSGTIAARSIVTEQLNVTSDNITINGVSLADYITSLLPQDTAKTAQAEEKMDFISPLSENSSIAVSLENSEFSVLNSSEATGSAVATIDSEGNASFSGSLTAQTIMSQGDATISGELTVDSLKAKTIDGLEDTVNALASRFMGPQNKESQTPHTEYLDIASMSAEFALFHENLLSLGTTTLREATIMDSLSVGTQLMIGPESIDVLDADLHIQPLRQGGISFLGGLMALDKDGNLQVGGDARFAKNVTIEGGLFANILSPLPGNDFDIFLPKKNSTQSAQFRIVNDAKTPVLTINDTGDVYSSGSAHFVGDLVASGSAFLSKLNIFSQDAQAISENEMVASSSAGTAVLKAYNREVTIKSPYVDQKSLIYITPSTNTGNQVLYLRRQSNDGSFTIGVNETLSTDVHFNWFVVN